MKRPLCYLRFLLATSCALLLACCGEDARAPEASRKPHAPQCPEMPAGGYKVGAAALTDIRALYDAAAHVEGFALTKGQQRMLSAYLLTGDPDQVDAHGVTLLHHACRLFRPALVEELIARGAEVNAVSWSMFDYVELTETGDVWRLAPLTPLAYAALPSSYLPGASAEISNRIIDMLLAAGADPLLGDSPLPHVARVEHDHVHLEDVFLHLLDSGLSLQEERRNPEPPAALRERMEKDGLRLDAARLSPRHREGTLGWLEYRRHELGCPWSRVEERLGIKPTHTHQKK